MSVMDGHRAEIDWAADLWTRATCGCGWTSGWDTPQGTGEAVRRHETETSTPSCSPVTEPPGT